jgi:hypothetical protein
MHGGFIGTLLGGIALVVGTYIFLNHSAAVGNVAGGSVRAYTSVAKSFQGG